MNALDERGRQAGRGINQAVAAGVSTDRIPGAAGRRVPGTGWSAAAGALAAVGLIFSVSVLRHQEVVADLTEVTPTTAPVILDPTTPPTTEPSTVPVVIPGTEPTLPPDTVAPGIVITFPESGYVSEEKAITFKGITEPGARVTAGVYEVDVDGEGNWSITLFLDKGTTTAVFKATDAAGNVSQASVSVKYRPVESTTTTEKKYGFWVSNTFGVSDRNPPYDVYYGEGAPGSTVTVVSEYGSGSTTVNADGGFEIKVFFETAPKNVEFPVKVKDSHTGEVRVFSFKALG